MRGLNDARDESDVMREIWDYAMGKKEDPNESNASGPWSENLIQYWEM
jgi:hypothetical protein